MRKLRVIEKDEKFGWLEVQEEVEPDFRGKRTYLCRCRCGNMSYVLRGNLLSGNTTSCGCRKRERTN